MLVVANFVTMHGADVPPACAVACCSPSVDACDATVVDYSRPVVLLLLCVCARAMLFIVAHLDCRTRIVCSVTM